MAFVFLLLFGFTTFYSFQLINEVIWLTKVHKLVRHLSWLLSYSSCLIVFIYYNLKRTNLLSFFHRWEKFEIQLALNMRPIDTGVKQIKRLTTLLYGSYLIMTCSNYYGFYKVMQNEPGASFLLSHHEILRNWLTIPLIFAIHLIGISLIWVLFVLLDLVPATIFYYTGSKLKRIEDELKEDFKTLSSGQSETAINLFSANKLKTTFSIRFRQTWLKYESLLDLTDEANRIFGILMFVDHGIKFFLICGLTFMSLSSFKDKEVDTVAAITTTVIFIYRFVTCILVASNLHNSSSKLKITASSLISRHCHKMSKEDRDLTVLFISRLQDHQLAARPLGLYRVTNSILLTILSLSISYVIILVQIK